MSVAELPIIHFVDGSAGQWPWRRQMPSNAQSFLGLKFDFSPYDCPTADWLVVFSDLPRENFKTRVPRERRIFFAAEPEAFHRYQTPFLEQFGAVVTSQTRVDHPNIVRAQPAINWFAGVRFLGNNQYEAALNYEDLVMKPSKTRLCSVVTSNKKITKGHKQRLNFVDQLQKELGDVIDFYGVGVNPIKDKDEALATYRYHIALENSVCEDYWTEKLADPFLRYCYPIYYGCPNIQRYFDTSSLASIDIQKPTQALRVIEKILSSDIDKKNASAIVDSHQRVMHTHNVFAEIKQYIASRGEKKLNNFDMTDEVLLTDHACKEFKWSRRAKKTLRSWVGLRDISK